MTATAPKLAAVDKPDLTRVCGIAFTAREDHLPRALAAWRKRVHPAWSQFAVTWRVTGAKMRRVK